MPDAAVPDAAVLDAAVPDARRQGEPGPALETWCIVARADHVLALPSASCSSSRTLGPVTPLPRAPAGVVGLTCLEGELLPVVDWLSAQEPGTGASSAPDPGTTTAILVTADPRGGERGSPRALLRIDGLLGMESTERVVSWHEGPSAEPSRRPSGNGRPPSPAPSQTALSDRWLRGAAELDVRLEGGEQRLRVSVLDPSAWLASIRAAAEVGP